MEHFSVLALLIQEHNKKYNEMKRLYRKMDKLSYGSEWRRESMGYNIWPTCADSSNPRYLVTGSTPKNTRYPATSVFSNKKNLAEYRKWCKFAASWRRAKREMHELLCGMRAVGKVCGTKVQTRSNDGMSFNRPFFIEIEGQKKPIKKFMDDQAFEDIMLKEK